MNRLKARRLWLGKSAEEVGDAIGKDRSTIYRWERQETLDVPSTQLEKLASALETTVNYLTYWTDDPLDYEDPELTAELPSRYMEACNNVEEAYRQWEAYETIGVLDAMDLEIPLLARQLQDARLKQEISQEGLAVELGVSKEVIRQWERGEVEPDAAMLRRICKCLHIATANLKAKAVPDERTVDNAGNDAWISKVEPVLGHLSEEDLDRAVAVLRAVFS